jgi:hypothetical protein
MIYQCAYFGRSVKNPAKGLHVLAFSGRKENRQRAMAYSCFETGIYLPGVNIDEQGIEILEFRRPTQGDSWVYSGIYCGAMGLVMGIQQAIK